MPGAIPVPVVIAALAPRMLRIAGEQADGTFTWMGHRLRSRLVRSVGDGLSSVNFGD